MRMRLRLPVERLLLNPENCAERLAAATIVSPRIFRGSGWTMMNRVCVALVVALLAPMAVQGQANEGAIKKQMGALTFYGGMRGGPPAMSDADRAAAIAKLSKDIASLPPGNKKVEYADQLAVISTQGQSGPEAMQSAADTLAAALKESPQPAAKDGLPAHPYMELAKMARYAG